MSVPQFPEIWREFAHIRDVIYRQRRFRHWLQSIAADSQATLDAHPESREYIFDHGWAHMKRVCRTLMKLLLQIGQPDLLYPACLAALTHDVGICRGKDGHAERSSELSVNFLSRLGLLRTYEIRHQVADAIRYHGDGGPHPTLLTAALAIADKIDLCRARALHPDSPVCQIRSYFTTFHAPTLTIGFYLANKRGRDSFFLIPKTYDVPKHLCHVLGWKLRFLVDGHPDNFSDRQHYHGVVYHHRGKVIS